MKIEIEFGGTTQASITLDGEKVDDVNAVELFLDVTRAGFPMLSTRELIPGQDESIGKVRHYRDLKMDLVAEAEAGTN
jgi:hypothetical protein